MIQIDYGRAELLFSRFDLGASLEASRKNVQRDIESAKVSAATTDRELKIVADEISQKHRVAPPILDEDGIYTSSERREIDVSQDFGRAIFDRSRPSMLGFEAVVFHVPFTGDRDLFQMRASTFSLNPPRAELAASELRVALIFEGDVDVKQLRETFFRELQRIKEALKWVTSDIGATFNGELVERIRTELELKRNRSMSTRSMLQDLGFQTAVPRGEEPSSISPASSTAAPIEESVLTDREFRYDFFISHASEDKDLVARPLYEALRNDYRVWFDEAELLVGDSLLDKIDDGLASCRFGIVIMSPRFFEKRWTQEELKGLRSRQLSSSPGIILPVWSGVDAAFLQQIHPPLADIKAANFADGIDAVVAQIKSVYSR